MNSVMVRWTAVAVLASIPAHAQVEAGIVGAWILESASTTAADGAINPAPFGEKPHGTLLYTGDGWMTAIISYDGRKQLTGADRVAAPAMERADAFASFFAYAGRYTVAGNRVTHHVEMASVENWVGTDLVRMLKVESNRLVLTTPKLSVNGKAVVTELIWTRRPGAAEKSVERTREE